MTTASAFNGVDWKKIAEQEERRANRLQTEVNEMWPLRKRADKAEQERDEYRAMHSQQIKTIARLQQNPRPLTADAIESVLHDILPLTTEHLGADDIADIASDLHAALTEPPRPEGAAELDPIVDRSIRGCDDITSPETVRLIANGLAEEGVRVTGGQS